MAGMRLFQVDAFAESPFHGNPAAVCLVEGHPSSEWMQNVALEMNLSETAFLSKQKDGYGLRWFTPAMEVDLCGHATLASAHVLWTEGLEPDAALLRFHTRSGILSASRDESMIELNFPETPAAPADPPDELIDALGVEPTYVGKSVFDRFLMLESEAALLAMRPNFERLGKIEMRGVIVTALSSDPGYDFVSRYFAPAAGINEDPVTGSAHCVLAPFWSQRLDKRELIGYQASQRGGIVHVRCEDDRVYLGGHAVTVLRGELVCD